ncbi:hypothetical protein TNCV_2148541 [Trichonephila clavipes]|uniref:Uncharacterized protein n=1 Tax=Trichonephila clavipes TaxID=2585209 RepID=A0A8X6SXV2_TRICX|nr:hypothetical protein TNCV_2148541 [Trichonephila clavipes]
MDYSHLIWSLWSGGHGHELVTGVSRVQAFVPLKTHCVEGFMVKSVYLEILPMTCWDSLERRCQLRRCPRQWTETQNYEVRRQ